MPDTNIYEMAQTWNNAATAFTAIKMDVTDTASAAGSNLLDLLVGGVSKFSVSKNSRVGRPGTYIDFGAFGNNIFTQVVCSGYASRFDLSGYKVASDKYIGWHQNPNASQSELADLQLHRDAANTLAQRNGTNAQAFNIYNSYTDASNYERGVFKWNSNILTLGVEYAGTGAQRGLTLSGWADTVSIAVNGVDRIRATTTSINPSVSGAINLGISPRQWGDLWASGSINFTGLPTADPAVAGQLWNDAGTVKVSAG